MSDFKGLFQTDAFRDYRKKQVECIGKMIWDKLGETEIKDQISLAIKLLKLPETMTSDKELKEYLEMQMVEDTANLTRYLMRNFINEQP
jgi:hypothetical protein